MPTLIIPAHNEANVIRACLDSIKDQADVDRIIVSCNGCTDNTADIVRNEYPNVHCIDIDTPSKIAAINAAEEHILSWPVFYIDADTQLSPNAVSRITAEMAQRNLLLAAPSPVIDTAHSSWPVKQFYYLWLSLPYIKAGIIATCSYVISEKGRKRWDVFPDVISDDGFVRSQFRPSERANVESAKIHIKAPKTLLGLIKIKTRAKLGDFILIKSNLKRFEDDKPYGRVLSQKLFSKDCLSTLVYLAITISIRLRAKWQLRHLSRYRWETDKTSREVVP